MFLWNAGNQTPNDAVAHTQDLRPYMVFVTHFQFCRCLGSGTGMHTDTNADIQLVLPTSFLLSTIKLYIKTGNLLYRQHISMSLLEPNCHNFTGSVSVQSCVAERRFGRRRTAYTKVVL